MTRRFVTVVLGVSAVAFAFTIALPHTHASSAASHLSASCRLCKVHDGLSTAPDASAPVRVADDLVLRVVPRQAEARPHVPVVDPHAPRAPPVLS